MSAEIEAPWNTNHAGYRDIFNAALSGICANPNFFGPLMQQSPRAAVEFADQIVIAAINRTADTIAGLIERLRSGEGNAVTLMCDNPDFNGQPNNAVEVVADWTDWRTVRFTGNTLLEALANAASNTGGTVMGEAP